MPLQLPHLREWTLCGLQSHPHVLVLPCLAEEARCKAVSFTVCSLKQQLLRTEVEVKYKKGLCGQTDLRNSALNKAERVSTVELPSAPVGGAVLRAWCAPSSWPLSTGVSSQDVLCRANALGDNVWGNIGSCSGRSFLLKIKRLEQGVE